jgi:guanylate kinase
MPRRKGIHCDLAVNMAKKRMETAKTNMLEAKAKNEEKRAHRLKMRLNRLDKRVSYVFIIYNRDFETISSIRLP